MEIKLGSLFDGSGGFPLAGALSGVRPVWASEVEPYPIAVTTSRFPKMKHIGDISTVSGAEIEPVDIITFGSPCQDLSVAGRRAGIEGERSGLFMQAVRICKEMREKTNGLYPTFAIWENVPGAFYSNKGEDFRVVLEELVRIVEPCAEVPPAGGGGWPYADCYMGDGWSLAYRVFDAQYWGVPQRRRRIHLIVDFRGERAPKVLFEPESLRGDTAESDRARKEAPAITGESTQYADYARCARLPECLGGNRIAERSTNRRAVAVHQNQSGEVRAGSVANTLATNGNASGRNAPLIAQVYDTRGNGDGATVGTITGDHNNRVTDYTAIAVLPFDTTQITSPINRSQPKYGDPCHPLAAQAHPPAICLQGSMIGRADKNGPQGDGVNDGVSFTLTEADRHAVAYHVDAGEPECEEYAVRRLTPTECARLQGFPDWWGHVTRKEDMTDEEVDFWNRVDFTKRVIDGRLRLSEEDGTWHIWSEKEDTGRAYKPMDKRRTLNWYNKLESESAEYKMWGNGIALPPARFVLERAAIQLRQEEHPE